MQEFGISGFRARSVDVQCLGPRIPINFELGNSLWQRPANLAKATVRSALLPAVLQVKMFKLFVPSPLCHFLEVIDAVRSKTRDSTPQT